MKLLIEPGFVWVSGDKDTLNLLHSRFSFRDKQAENQLKRFLRTCAAKENAGRGGPGWEAWKNKTAQELRNSLVVHAGRFANDDVLVFPVGLLHSIKEALLEYNCAYEQSDKRVWDFPRRLLGKPQRLRPYQQDAISIAIERKTGMLRCATGTGKCYGKDTPILMFDGSIKKVQDIKNGDLLMGPDSLPRRVSSTTEGEDDLFEIVPLRGESWVCNSVHVLSLRCTADHGNKYKKDAIDNIPLNEYLEKDKTYKHMMKIWRTGVDWPEKQISFDPYVLGLWLGDGTRSNPSITNSDPEIISYLKEWALKNELKIREVPGNNTTTFCFAANSPGGDPSTRKINILQAIMNECQKTGEKRIPEKYKTTSREIRQKVLAGLIDTDGYLTNGCFELVFKDRGLAEDCCFIARSLGLMAVMSECEKGIKKTGFVGTYFRIFISGDTEEIPVLVSRKKANQRKQKKNVLNTGFSVKPLGCGKYYGFELEGKDRLHLLGDFTVSHNTVLGQELIRHFGFQSLFLVPSRPILEQTVRRFRETFGKKNVGVFGGGKKDPSWVTVATYQSINASNESWQDYKLICADEVHHVAADTFFSVMTKKLHHAPYVFGLTADEERADGATVLVEAATGPVLFSYDAPQAIADGHLAKPTFMIYEVNDTAGKYKTTEVDPQSGEEIVIEKEATPDCSDRYMEATKNWLIGNDLLHNKIAAMASEFATNGDSVLILVDEKEQGEKLVTQIPGAEFITGGGKSNEKTIRAFNSRQLKVLIATSVLGEGADTVPVNVLINLMGGTRPKQANGRALRNDPDPDTGVPRKPTCLIIDFDFPKSSILSRHSELRQIVHKTCGEVHRSRLI